MSEEETQNDDEQEAAETATAVENENEEASEDSPAPSEAEEAKSPAESVPEFQPLRAGAGQKDGNFELNRFGGVQVVLTAELGRTQLTLQELMSLSEGAVLELNRSISEPVELMAQGVPLGNAEVVVVDDQFAIRVKQIYAS